MYIQCFHSERIRQRSRLRWRKGEVYPRWDTQKRVSFWINKANTGSNVSLTARGNCASNCLNIKRSCTASNGISLCKRLRKIARSLELRVIRTWIVFHIHNQNTQIRKMDLLDHRLPIFHVGIFSNYEMLKRYCTFLFLTMTMIETNRGESKDKLKKMVIRYICNFLCV